ncbi:low molecular weight protein-tyrosine-phosphatase [Virgibacillus ainsalahensis]
MIRVLFVCLGNICRSPMAEAVFRDLVQKDNLSGKIEVDSSGTGEWHIGEAPHEGTRNLLEKQQISYEGMFARQVNTNDWDAYDYIIAMDEQNIMDLKEMNQNTDEAVVKKLMEFVDDPDEINIPDPYFTGDFNYTYKLVSKGCKNLLSYIKETHNIK